ncbi:MAG TPA: protein kinase [Gemmataceae bacterium]|jgi:serine/threonine protein kinase
MSTPCPDRDRLQKLLDSGLPPPDETDVVRHLDDCPGCQQALEGLATGEWSWAEPARGCGGAKPPDQSAFWPALRSVEAAVAVETTAASPDPVTVPEEVSLDFLSPAEDPAYLGRLNHFNVEAVVGRGGMGIVLKALDPCLQRTVAVKVLDPLFARNELARQRFCREARAAAAVTHENVIAVHEVDIDKEKDLPYIVMQYVSGVTLQDRLDRGDRLSLREVVRIGQQTAAGLAAAHDQGLVHRDIKPGNILLEAPLGRVKLTDFGLARAAEDSKLTQTGFVAGTPLYMAPEQAKGEPVDARSDLFSLGGVLYAMCTGRPPFEASSPFLVLRRVTEEAPRPVQDLNPAVPDDLADLIDHLLEKNPADRPQSAAEVADRLGHVLTKLPADPVITPPATPVRRTTLTRTRPPAPRWVRWPAVAAVIGLSLLGVLFLTELGRLTHFTALSNGPPADVSRRTVPAGGSVWAVRFAPDGHTLAMGIDDGTVRLWDPGTTKVRQTITAHASPVWSLAYSADGKLLATASDDGAVKVWDAATGGEVRSIPHPTAVRAVAFTPDGKTLVSGTRNGKVRFWDVATGNETVTTAGHTGNVVALAVSADGRTVASASGDKTVKLWDAATGREQMALRGHPGAVFAVAFSPDGQTVATGGWGERPVRLWDAADGQERAELRGHTQDVWGVAFSPDGRLLASASEDHTVRLWDVATGKERAVLTGHTGTVYTVAFTPDGRTLASGSRDGTVKLWDVQE